MGWLRRKFSKEKSEYAKATDYSVAQELCLSTREFLEKYHNEQENIISVNDHDNINGYNEDNPKDRAVHLLTEMVAAGY